MMYFTFFCTITLFIFLFFVLGEERKQWVKQRLKLYVDDDKKDSKNLKDRLQTEPFLKRIFYPFFYEIKRSFKRKISDEKEAKIEMKLLQAGNPQGMSPVDFRLFQMALLLLLPTLLGILSFFLKKHVGVTLLFILIGITGGVIIPHYYLSSRIKKRSHQALRELPDVVDLLTVSLEAGLGFDAALSKLISKKDGILVSEFHRCLEEIRLGKTRREALAGVRDRVLVDPLNVLISSIIQAEKLGISMVHILRIQSHEVRQQRKQRAEEEAMKAPIKMLFPLILFIFPSLFIVLLGPAVIQFLLTFKK
ncbi:MAG: type II secretion system F family protein [Bacillota bacterium]